MKTLMRNKLAIFVLLFAFQLQGQTSINFVENDLNKVIEQSAATTKPVFLVFYADWCPHCTKMKKEVLSDPNLIDILNKNCINSRINIETNLGKDMSSKLGVKALPTFIIMDKNQTILYSFEGGYTIKEFENELKKGLNPTTQLPYLEKKFNDDVSNSQNCLAYLSGLRRGIHKDKSVEIVNKYIATKTNEELLSEINWKILMYGIAEISDKNFSFVIKNKNQFAAIVSKKTVETNIFNAVNKSLKLNVKKSDTLSYAQNKVVAKSIQSPAIDSLLFRFDIQIYEKVRDWKTYKKVTKEAVPKWTWKDYKTLNEVSKNYLENTLDTEELKLAIVWAKRSMELNETHEVNFLIAKLYHKIKDKTQAIAYARKTKAIISQMGWDAKTINAFGKELGVKDF